MKKKAPKKKDSRETVARFLFCLGVVNLVFVFLTFAAATLGFVFKVGISPFHMVAALAGAALAGAFMSWYYYGQKHSVDVKIAASLIAAFVVLLLACGLVAHSFYDVSYDGQWYHEGAVDRMMNGYDPLYDHIPDSYSGGTYITHYPKALETSAAVISTFTGHIEDGKLLGLFLMITAFLFIYPAITFAFPGLGAGYALIIGALCALNPISVYQSMSYYVDGVSASLLAILVFLLILSYKKMDIILYAVISGVVVLAMNVKIFNLVYVGIIVAGFIVLCRIYGKATRLHYLLAVSLLIGLLFGANPYITNLIGHGTPFYPVEGVDTGMIAADTPPNLLGMNQAGQFAYSLFSESSVKKEDARLKIPLTVTGDEAYAFYNPDARAGGFGPLFSAALILAAILAILLVYFNMKDKRPLSGFILLACLFILITALINPASWWARYVPQFWLVPLLLLACAGQRLTGSFRLLNYALILLLAVNLLWIAVNYYSFQQTSTGLVVTQLDQLKALSARDTVKLYPGPFPALEERLKEYGINYIVIDSLTPGDDGYPLSGGYDKARFYVNVPG